MAQIRIVMGIFKLFKVHTEDIHNVYRRRNNLVVFRMNLSGVFHLSREKWFSV